MRGQGMPRPYSAREPSVGAGHARPGPPRITRRGTFSTIVRIPSAEDYMKLFVFFLLAVALVLSAADVNVTGKWSGSVNVTQPDGTNEEGTTFAILKQDGGTVTGTAGPDEATQWTIEKGAIAGNKVTLQVRDSDGTTTYKCDLVAEGDHLKGSVTIVTGDGQTVAAKLDLRSEEHTSELQSLRHLVC